MEDVRIFPGADAISGPCSAMIVGEIVQTVTEPIRACSATLIGRYELITQLCRWPCVLTVYRGRCFNSEALGRSAVRRNAVG